MNRNESSRLGELQSEGNLGNERNRRSVRDSGHERMRNQWSESPSDMSSGDSGISRDSDDRGSEEWSSDDSDSSATRRSSR